MHKRNTGSQGFTIVELLIVIVVIAILASISTVAYTGIQGRARDAQRHSDIRVIAQALEMYYLDNGSFPSGVCSPSCPTPKKINGSWATTSDGSWSVLEAALVPTYISALPKDPSWSLSTNAAILGGYNYDYVLGDYFCGAPSYLLTYQLESSPRKSVMNATGCATYPSYPSSQYFVKM